MTFHDYMREYRRNPQAMEGVRGLLLLQRVGVRGAAGRPPCRMCGTDACRRPECFRSILIRHRLDEHATAAERDAATRRNGHGSR